MTVQDGITDPASFTAMADLARSSAERFRDAVAARFQRDGEWAELTYTELWERARAVAGGLVALGVGVGDRVSILANTRVEFTVVQYAASTAGAIVVPVYPTNSPQECEWVVGDSGAKVIFCENAAQVAKINQVRAGLPELEHVIVIDGEAEGALALADVVARGGQIDDAELRRRADDIAPDDPCLIIYTSGTTGPPKGVVLTNRGFAIGRRCAVEMELFDVGDVIYLYLPLAHVFAQLVQADSIEIGATLAYWGGDPKQIVGELAVTQPTVLPSVPRIFEKVYAVAMALVPPEREQEFADAIRLGVAVRLARRRGEEVSAADAERFEKADAEMFALVRGIFGGRLKLAISGAAPIAPEILEFFYAAGVPVFEGWGMTETTSLGTLNLPDAFKFGTIGRPVAGADIRIAGDGEIQIAGEIVMKEYWRNPEATAKAFTADHYLHTGDLGTIDEDGYVTITGRQKDIIITAGGKNLTPANLEGDLRRSRWISQAVMFGDRRPYPVALITLDAEEIVPWAEAQGLPADVAALAESDEVVGMIQAELNAANAHYAQVEQIKRFKILARDFTLESGELTPSLKLKRNVIYENYAEEFDSLYR